MGTARWNAKHPVDEDGRSAGRASEPGTTARGRVRTGLASCAGPDRLSWTPPTPEHGSSPRLGALQLDPGSRLQRSEPSSSTAVRSPYRSTAA